MTRYITTLIMLFAACMAGWSQDKGEWPWHEMQLGITGGSTGVGIELAMPVAKDVRVRIGGTYMPKFEKTMNFGVEVGMTDDAKTKQYYMDNIRSFMSNFINYDLHDNIDMIGSPTFGNAKILIDWTPLKDKRWHVTAGVYLGNKTIAKAKNRQEDMSTLMGVNMYNTLYKKGAARQPMFTAEGVDVDLPNHFVNAMLVHYGEMAIQLGEFSHDIVAQEDIYWDYDYYEYGTNALKHSNGDLRCAKGEVLYHEGDVYRMKPNADNEVWAKAKVNAIRPYLGIGYDGTIRADRRIGLSVDAGVMMWGGSPSLVTHDGIDLVKDLRNVRGKVGDYVKLTKKITAFPVVEVKLTYNL